jgi:hypothetical protein
LKAGSTLSAAPREKALAHTLSTNMMSTVVMLRISLQHHTR